MIIDKIKDYIKELVDERPETKVVYYWFVDTDVSRGEFCQIKEYRTFRDYNVGEITYLIGIVNRQCRKHIIHEKNI